MKKLTVTIACAATLGAGTAHADGPRLASVVPLPAYQQECGACHLAYPPGLLPAASWQHLMAGLKQHYGTDASIDPATAQSITAWLSAHATTARRTAEAPPQDRITRSSWFVREHREVAPAVWQRPSIKSAAQCSACHTGAERGRFDEQEIRIPRS